MVLLIEIVLIAGDAGKMLFEAEDFLLQSFNVELLAFAVCSMNGQQLAFGSNMISNVRFRRNFEIGKKNTPLSLTIKFLSSRQSWLTVWLRSATFQRLAVN